MKGCEENPEIQSSVEDAHDPDEDDEGQGAKGRVGIAVDVWMSGLVNLEQDQDGDCVHESRIELEIDMAWTDVITSAHDSFHNQSKAHCVIHAKVLWDSVLPVVSGIFSDKLPVHQILPGYNEHEEKSEKHIAKVGEDVVEIAKDSQRMSTEKVVVAEILVSGGIGHILISEHELNHWKAVENGDRQQIPMIQIGFPSQNSRRLSRQI